MTCEVEQRNAELLKLVATLEKDNEELRQTIRELMAQLKSDAKEP